MRLTRLLSLRGRPLGPGDVDSGIAPWSKAYANLPERYLLRRTRYLVHKPPVAHPGFRTVLKITPLPEANLTRPWTDAYWQEHRVPGPAPGQAPLHGTLSRPIRRDDWMWFPGDRVQVMRGKDKGKQGYIDFVVQERAWVTVEGINLKRKLVGRTSTFPGMLQLTEQPLSVPDDVRLVDPHDELVCEAEWAFTEDGERVRVSKRTGRIIPMPERALTTIDYKSAKGYKENKSKDTTAKDVEEITFDPKLCTFEMEIMQQMGIKEDRVPQKTFFY